MKKLRFFICLVAVLLVSTQVLTAQVTGSATADPGSNISGSTFGRFRNDVDRYFNVNDWVDVQFNKWFSFLRMDDIGNAGGITNEVWDGGLAIQLPKETHLGLYYKGRYNSGQRTDTRTTTIDDAVNGGTITRTGPDFGGMNLWNGGGTLPGGAGPNNVEHRNYFGVLLGTGNHGFRLTVEDNLDNIDYPYVYTSATKPAATQAQIDAGAKNFQEIPIGTEGSFRKHGGYIKPSIMWGAASPMNFGKYSSKPNVRVDLRVQYANSYELTNLVTPSGDTLDDIRYYNGNTLTPLIAIDSNRIVLWSGDWGTLGFGASNEFDFSITDDGANGMDSWNDKLQPYAIFTYTATDYLSFAARLDVPLQFGWTNNGPGVADNTYFGIGPRAVAADYNHTNLPIFRAGFQLKGSFLDKLADRYGIFDKLAFNFGIRVNLPGYLYATNYTYYNHDEYDPDAAGSPYYPDGVQVTSNGVHHYLRPTNWLEQVAWGLTFFLTPNISIDATLANDWKQWGFNSDIILGSVLISIKHNGPKAPAPAPAPAPAAAATEE